MIPYFQQPSIDLPGPFAIHGWGVMVCIGIIFGTSYAGRQAQRVGLDPYVIDSYGIWCVISGFIGAHFVHVLAYTPQVLKEHPLELLKIWAGFSSFGGFLGAFVGTILFKRVHKIEIRTYMDSLVRGFAPGWMFGRIGCFMAHDHPGKNTDFFLGLKVPDHATNVKWTFAGCTIQPGFVRDQVGPFTARHDLGLYDAMLAATIWAIVMAMRPVRGRGVATGTAFIIYGSVRFCFDYLRIADRTYLGLTPAQYMCFPLVAGGVWLIWKGRKEVREGYEPYPDAPKPEATAASAAA